MPAIVRLAALCAGFLIVGVTNSAEKCRVVDPELQTEYVGSCADGLATGFGKAKGSAAYEGRFRNGLKHGKGEKRWPNGDVYMGEFVDDRRHGQGKYFWGRQSATPGDIYSGQYVNDQRAGFGAYEWATGDKFIGTWVDDQRTGPTIFEVRQRQARLAAANSAKPFVGGLMCRSVPDGEIAGSDVKARLEAVSESGVLRLKIIEVSGPQHVDPVPFLGKALDADPLEWQWCAGA